MPRAKWYFLVLCQLSVLCSKAQVSESFTDGNYTANPIWSGSAGSWIVNASGQLQSSNTVANSSFYLSTASTLAVNSQWEFYVRINFNTSSLNYTDVYLLATSSDLSAVNTTGYFVRLGNTQDDICLYRKDAAGIITKLIDGVDGTTNHSDNTIKIKVIRDAGDQFTLFRDLTGIGNNYISEGSFTDHTYTNSSYFGFLVLQSTSSFFGKHFFDDISIQPYAADVAPPSLLSVKTISNNALDLVFSEVLDASSAQETIHYTLDHNIRSPATSTIDAANHAIVHLSFNTAFENRLTYNLTIDGVADIAGNVLHNARTNFTFESSNKYDLIIDEIMADPSPPVNLPDAEYVEIKNISDQTINLAGYRLQTNNAISAPFPDYDIPAGSFLILCSNSNLDALSAYGNALGIPSFPALTNTGTTLSLISNDNRLVHAVRYNMDAYQNTIKADGGWSLEMIDTNSPCSGIANWKASSDESGGTPGRVNSVNGVYEDNTPPQLLHTFSLDSVTVIALFNEPLDSANATLTSAYNFTGNSVIQAVPQGPLFTSVLLKLAMPIAKGQVYTLSINGITDCKGNEIGLTNHAKAGLPQTLLASDVLINEILFNPRPNASDYIECYNRSNKIADLHQLYIANRTATGSIGAFKQITDTTCYLFPGDYIVITEDPVSLVKEYLVKDPSTIIKRSAMPSYPDDKGYVVLSTAAETVIDEVEYDEKWHFPLISNKEGVALERIDPSAPSQTSSNWHSAASTAGYGTPGYINSQYKKPTEPSATITVTPKVFSPDNDGHDDLATITYQLEERGYLANITIFDANGHLMRYLVKNDLLGLQGSWTWDGLDEQHRKLPTGTYIIYTQLFDLKGNKMQYKNTITVATPSF